MILPLIILAAQVPTPLGAGVKLSWETQDCGAAQCEYFISRAAIPKGTGKCPTNVNYTPMNYGFPVIGTTFTDFTPTKLTVCYEVQITTGAVTDKPSAPVGPFVVP